MTNIVSFEDFDTEFQIEAHQIGLPRVVLEGETDVKLFKTFWFTHLLEKMQFVEPSDVIRGTGCTAVGLAVDFSVRNEGIPAVGIVDRDTLFRERRWDVLFSTDEAEFVAQAHAADLYVASLWEVEAYLLEAEFVLDWVRGNNRPESECGRALTWAVEECEGLLHAAAFFAASHQVGQACSPAYFSNVGHRRIAEDCQAIVAGFGDVPKATAEQVKAMIDAIFEAAPTELPARLPYLLRYVDTKRLLVRLEKRLHLATKSYWHIANLMLRLRRRPPELEGYLTDFAGRFAA